MLPWTETWCEEKAVKEAMYGPKGKSFAGGPMHGTERPGLPDDKEPVHWHSVPPIVIQELIHAWNIRVLLDATASDDSVGLACLRQKCSYIGMTWTAEHSKRLQARLKHALWKEYTKETSPLHQPIL